jgi:mRNA interferase MazF
VNFGVPVGREQSGHRPAVVVSADPLNDSRAGVVIVVPCTTARRGLPSHVEIDRASSGLDEVCYAKCEDIKSVSDERLAHRHRVGGGVVRHHTIAAFPARYVAAQSRVRAKHAEEAGIASSRFVAVCSMNTRACHPAPCSPVLG